MPGPITQYGKLSDAVRDGWEVYDRTPTGYTLRKRTEQGFVLGVWEPNPKPVVDVPDEQC